MADANSNEELVNQCHQLNTLASLHIKKKTKSMKGGGGDFLIERTARESGGATRLTLQLGVPGCRCSSTSDVSTNIFASSLSIISQLRIPERLILPNLIRGSTGQMLSSPNLHGTPIPFL
jgi:hypothetical protein